jgi:hypothetical protein
MGTNCLTVVQLNTLRGLFVVSGGDDQSLAVMELMGGESGGESGELQPGRCVTAAAGGAGIKGVVVLGQHRHDDGDGDGDGDGDDVLRVAAACGDQRTTIWAVCGLVGSEMATATTGPPGAEISTEACVLHMSLEASGVADVTDVNGLVLLRDGALMVVGEGVQTMHTN